MKRFLSRQVRLFFDRPIAGVSTIDGTLREVPDHHGRGRLAIERDGVTHIFPNLSGVARIDVFPLPLSDKDLAQLLETPIFDIEWSVRTRHCMNLLGIKTIGELTSKTEKDFMSLKNFGVTGLREIQTKLGEIGLGLRCESGADRSAQEKAAHG